MTQTASQYHSSFSPPFGLAHYESEEDLPDALPRWSKVLQARQDIDAGLYDDAEAVGRKLDGCMDRLLADLFAHD